MSVWMWSRSVNMRSLAWSQFTCSVPHCIHSPNLPARIQYSARYEPTIGSGVIGESAGTASSLHVPRRDEAGARRRSTTPIMQPA